MACRPGLWNDYVGVGVVVTSMDTISGEIAVSSHQVVEHSSIDIHSIINYKRDPL